MTEARKFKLGFIGAGSMAEAIVRGVTATSLIKPAEIIAADPDPERRKLFSDVLGVCATADNAEVMAAAPAVVLAIKPQQFDAVAPPASTAGQGSLLISICAGISISRIEGAFAAARVIRTMPNTPLLVGKGITAIAAGTRATENDLAFAEKIFGSCGATVRIDERLIDAVTAVSGSGPAYFFYLVEAMEAAAVGLGLSEAQARDFVRATFEGSAKLLAESGDSAAALRKKVTSPGGTTEAALGVLDDGEFKKLIDRAVRAAADRSKDLSK
ncbi:MAG: pyrroline-5-carboxylate reductase [Planctomycetia bacterium]|nr:pyrroline-5-carboxylate reductase [Planctomycetia bacterium]